MKSKAFTGQKYRVGLRILEYRINGKERYLMAAWFTGFKQERISSLYLAIIP
jgi:hypothetical protein